ncbi:MAG: BrnA antitoxin family protein [Phycisphaerae bacterium]|nr:BrnA antitoxin family protein [Phycisphaerae bacterium]
MKSDYDFSRAKRNPYAKRLKRSITIRLDHGTIEYFKRLAEKTALPYQSLINLYLRDCASSGRQLAMKWQPLRKGTV